MSNESYIAETYPLSPQQQGMFFESEVSNNRGIHVEQSVWRLDGRLDRVKFQQAWQLLVDRHPVLRTCFAWGDAQEPVQVVLKPFKIRIRDLQRTTSDSMEDCLKKYLAETAGMGFRLSKPPLMNFALLTESDEHHYFIWNHHHILLDGWSVRLLAEELLARYSGTSIPNPPNPYKTYIEWLGHQDGKGGERYWKQLFNRPVPATTPGEAVTGSQHEIKETLRHSCTVSKTVSRRLRELAKSSGATLNHLLKAAWAVVLSSWHPGSAVCYGVTVSGRPYQLEGSDSMIGLFINSLPEPIRISGDSRLKDLILQIQEMEFERESSEFYTTGQIHQWSGLPGSKPLFESLLVFDEQNHQSAEGTGGLSIQFEERWYGGGKTGHPLTLLFNAADEISFELVADSAHLSHHACHLIGRYITTLLESIAERGENEPVAQLQAGLPDENPKFSLPPRPVETTAPEIPDSNLNSEVLSIWKEVLGLDEIHPGARFFDLGGHSLMAMQIANRIRDRYKVEIPLRSLFQNPTIEGMSAQVHSISESLQRITAAAGSISGEEDEGEL